MAEQLLAGRSEQRAHARADVGDAIVGIDLPQPTHAALLIFLEQQARAFALAADIGVGLQLVEGPARDGQDAEDRDAEREEDRQHVLKRHAVPLDQQRSAHAYGEGDHPGRDAGRHDDQAERGDAEAGHDRGGDDLGTGIERREEIERQAEPEAARSRDFADHHPHRNPSPGAADAVDRLNPREMHRAEVHDRRRRVSHGMSHVAGTPHRFGSIITAATIFAPAKNGASWARDISWTSRSGELSDRSPPAASPANSPPGSRAEINRLYRSGASYIRPPFNCR